LSAHLRHIEVAQIQAYLDLGLTHFLLWFMDAPDPAGLGMFVHDVMPRFR